ncbi:MAG: TolC family protein [Proteobacteria bacterium]|nr:TolC family protein [Pseudomonadota bacterium]
MAMKSCFRYLGASALLVFSVRAPAEALSFSQALQTAEQRSAILDASQLSIDAARAAAIPADTLPDPKLVAGIDNFPVSGPEAGALQRDFMTMQKIGVMQEIPNSTKRRARAAVAAATIGVAAADRRVARLGVQRDTALAWIDLYYSQQKQAQFIDWQRENALFADAVVAQLAAGRGMTADALGPRQEAVQLADQQDELERDVARARATLRAFVGADADEGLQGGPPDFPIDPQMLQRHLAHHPELLSFDAGADKAKAELAEARSAKRSDWAVELDYARRAPQFGNMVSLQFTVDLPLWPSSRQDPLISAKNDALHRIEAEREATLREHQSELEAQLADYASLARQVDRAQRIALPLADQKVSLQMASYQAGKGDLAAVLLARRERIEQRLRLGELVRQQALLATRLHFAYGEDAP